MLALHTGVTAIIPTPTIVRLGIGARHAHGGIIVHGHTIPGMAHHGIGVPHGIGVIIQAIIRDTIPVIIPRIVPVIIT